MCSGDLTRLYAEGAADQGFDPDVDAPIPFDILLGTAIAHLLATGQPMSEAAAELEFLANEFATNPRYAPEANPAVSQQLETARREMRGYLGIEPTAAPELVIAGLRRAAAGLRAGSRAQAEAALSGPAFVYGPAATLGRLASMPRLPRVAEAAGGVAAEIDRLERPRR